MFAVTIVSSTLPASVIYTIALVLLFAAALLIAKWQELSRLVAFAAIAAVIVFSARSLEEVRFSQMHQPSGTVAVPITTYSETFTRQEPYTIDVPPNPPTPPQCHDDCECEGTRT